MAVGRSGSGLAVAIEILGSAGPAIAESPPLADPFFLPGDSTPRAAAQTQERPRISRGANGYLVVWADRRSSLVVPGGPGTTYEGEGRGTMTDVYAARLDNEGNLLDTTPILLSREDYHQYAPQAAWNGQNWLVVWAAEREHGNFVDVLGLRVAPNGAVLDGTPILVHRGDQPSADSRPWSAASDGTRWIVAWRDLDAATSVYTIEGARVAADGTVLDPGGRPLRRDTWNSDPQKADLAFAAGRYLMVWREADLSLDKVIRGQLLDTALDPIGEPFTINLYSPSDPDNPAVASNGSAFFVAWHEGRYFGFSQLYGSRVSAEGAVLDPGGIALVEDGGYTTFEPDVAWDGSYYFVGYAQQLSLAPVDADVFVRRVRTNGTLAERQPHKVADSGAEVALAPGAPSGVVLTQRDRDDIQRIVVGADGQAGTPAAVSLGAPRQSRPRFAFDGTNHLVVFVREASEETFVMAQRLDANGDPIDPEPILVAGGNGETDLTTPAAGWDGSRYLVVWERTREGRGTIYGRRLGADGARLDAAPFPIMPGQMPDVAGLDGMFLVVGTDNDVSLDIRYAYAIRVDTSGNVLGPRQRIGQNFDVWPRVTAFGSRWFAVWEQNVTHDNPRSRIVGAFIGQDGLLQTKFDISACCDGGHRDRPHLAVGGDTALVVWQHDRIFGRRVLADGTLLDSAAGIRISSGTVREALPAAGWDGTQWVVTWVDHRNEPYPKQHRGDLFAARVAADGSVTDPENFAVAETSEPEDTPAVSAAGSSWLFGYAAFAPQAPLANLRLGMRTNSPLPPSAAPGKITGWLTVAKNPNGIDLDLSWGPTCGDGTDYAVYEGALGNWYSHEANLCSSGGAPSATITPQGGDRYFLVVAHDPSFEGSYGTDGAGQERPAATAACRPQQNTAACP